MYDGYEAFKKPPFLPITKKQVKFSTIFPIIYVYVYGYGYVYVYLYVYGYVYGYNLKGV